MNYMDTLFGIDLKRYAQSEKTCILCSTFRVVPEICYSNSVRGNPDCRITKFTQLTPQPESQKHRYETAVLSLPKMQSRKTVPTLRADCLVPAQHYPPWFAISNSGHSDTYPSPSRSIIAVSFINDLLMFLKYFANQINTGSSLNPTNPAFFTLQRLTFIFILIQ